MNDEEVKQILINGIVDLKAKAGVNYSLGDVGVTPGDIPELAT